MLVSHNTAFGGGIWQDWAWAAHCAGLAIGIVLASIASRTQDSIIGRSNMATATVAQGLAACDCGAILAGGAFVEDIFDAVGLGFACTVGVRDTTGGVAARPAVAASA
jgi:hypothetical protein